MVKAAKESKLKGFEIVKDVRESGRGRRERNERERVRGGREGGFFCSHSLFSSVLFSSLLF